MSNQKRQTIDFDQTTNFFIRNAGKTADYLNWVQGTFYLNRVQGTFDAPEPDADLKFLVDILEKIDEQSETRDDR